MDYGIRSKNKMPPGTLVNGFLKVGDAIVDCGACRIISCTPQVKITPKVLAVLLELARHEGETVARDTLLDTVWAETHPTPDVVKQAIMELRKAFGSDGEESSIVETIPRLGYRLLVKTRYSETLKGLSQDVEAPANASPYLPETAQSRFNLSSGHVLMLFALGILAVVTFLWVTNENKISSASPNAVIEKPVRQETKLNYRLLTSDIGTESFPSVSPDGTRVAYTVAEGATAKTRIRIETADGSGRAWLNESTENGEAMAIWSPDGGQIAYMGQADDGSCKILAKPIVGGYPYQVAGCWRNIAQFYDWAPDGKSLLLSQAPSNSNPMGRLALIDIENQKFTALNYPKEKESPDYEPRYSPDGNFVAFRRGIQPNMDLFLYDIRNNATEKLTGFKASLKGFAWSASGKHIVFSSNHDGQYELYAYEMASKKIHALGVADAANPSISRKANVLAFEKNRIKRSILEITESKTSSVLKPTTASDEGARISPDGSSLAFISTRSGYQELWLIAKKQQEDQYPVRLTQFNGQRLSHINWSPDGKKLLVLASIGDSSRLFEIDVNTKSKQRLMPESAHIKQAVYGKDSGEIFVSAVKKEDRGVIWRGIRGENGYLFTASSIAAEDFRYSSSHKLLVSDFEKKNTIYLFDASLRRIKDIKLPVYPMWWLEKNGSIYFTAPNSGAVYLYRMDIETERLEKLIPLKGIMVQWTHPWFDISNDEKSMYLTAVEQDDTDVAIAKLPEGF